MIISGKDEWHVSPNTLDRSQAYGHHHESLPRKGRWLAKATALVFLFYVLKTWLPLSRGSHRPAWMSDDCQKQEQIGAWKVNLSTAINKTRLRERLRYLTLVDRVAGSEGSLSTAHWVQDIYDDAGLENIHVEE